MFEDYYSGSMLLKPLSVKTGVEIDRVYYIQRFLLQFHLLLSLIWKLSTMVNFSLFTVEFCCFPISCLGYGIFHEKVSQSELRFRNDTAYIFRCRRLTA